MPRLRFWKRDPSYPDGAEDQTPPRVASRARGFTPPPPKTPRVSRPSDLASASQFQAERRYDALLDELQRAESALQADNPWMENVAVIDEAIAVLDREIAEISDTSPEATPKLPEEIPVSARVTRSEAPATVHVVLGQTQLDFSELVDWAERGTTEVRGELRADTEMPRAIEVALSSRLNQELVAHLETSLLRFATDARDRALETGIPLLSASLSDLASPCEECGGYRLWNGPCLSCELRKSKITRKTVERNHLFDERAQILKDREQIVEQLPTLRRRVAEAAAASQKTNLDPT